MSLFLKIMLIALAGQMGLALFLMFGSREVLLVRRVIAAAGATGMAICLAAVVFAPPDPHLFTETALTRYEIIFLLVINLSLAVRLVLYFRNREQSFSCLGTVGRAIGCVAVAWGAFVCAMLAIAGMWAVVIALS